MNIKFKRLHSNAKVPTKATSGSAGFDCYVPVNMPPIQQGEIRKVPLGFSIQPESGYCVRLIPRSGLASKGLIIPNSPALIDEDYTGEVCVLLLSMGGIFPLNAGDRICQLTVEKVVDTHFDIVDEVEETERGEGGFGSTGTN
jgi:dUTP pyrophosphatase